MKTSEAFQSVAEALTDLKLIDRWGDPLVGIEAAGCVAHFHGQQWEIIMDQFEAGAISPEEYRDKARGMILDFKQHLFREALNRKLVQIRNEQMGVA